MGWRDGKPLDDTQPSAPAPPQPTAPQPSAPQPQSGWRSGQPLNQPAPVDTSTTTAPPTAMPAALTPDVIDPNASVGSKLLSLIHNFAVGGNLSTRAADDYLTRGYGDVAQAKVESMLSPSPTIANVVKQQVTGGASDDRLSQLRAQTQAAHEAMGYADPVLGVGTAMVGGVANAPAMVSDAVKSATLLASSPRLARFAGYGAGAATAGVQNAVDAALGTLGHGGSIEDAETAAKWGGGIGLGLGLTGVGSAKGAPRQFEPLPSFQTTAELEAIRNAKYAPMRGVKFDPDHITGAYEDGFNSLEPNQRADLSYDFNSKVNQHLREINGGNTVSASDVDGYSRGLEAAAQNGSKADQVLAGRITSNLEGDRGVLATAPTLSGHAPGEAADMQAAAKEAHQRYANSAMVDEWRRQASLPRSGGIGAIAPDEAAAALKANPNLYTDPEVNDAMRGIAGSGSWLPSKMVIKHALGYPVAAGVVGALGGGVHGYAAGGEDPWGRALKEAGIVGGGSLAAMVGAPWLSNRLANVAINRSLPALTQGAPYGAPKIGDLLRSVMLSRGERGAGY